jgi:hypothetical protein
MQCLGGGRQADAAEQVVVARLGEVELRGIEATASRAARGGLQMKRAAGNAGLRQK